MTVHRPGSDVGGSVRAHNDGEENLKAVLAAFNQEKALHPLSEVTNILYLLTLVILTSFLMCSHWLTQSQKEADIYYLFIIG